MGSITNTAASGPALPLVEPVAAGVYEPLFLSAAGLADVSGLSVASGGGLIAATAGTAGTGTLTLPSLIDSTRPWRFAVLFEWNGDSTHPASVYLQARTSVPSYNLYGLGLSGTDGANHTCSTAVAGGASLFQALSMTAGQRYWYTVCSDGTTVNTVLMPYNHAGVAGVANNVALGYAPEVEKSYAASLVANSLSVFTNLGAIHISNASATTKILGIYCQPSSLLGAPDARCQPPAIVLPTISTDTSASVRLPRAYTGRMPTDVVLVGHPNGSDSQVGLRYADPDTGTAIASLVNAGYIVASILGDPSTAGYTSATASDWGAPAGLAYRFSLLAWIRANLPNTRYVYWLGHSMGCLDGLMFHATYPGVLRGLIGISGVTNLSDSYSSRGFSAAINAAYGVSSLGNVTDYDPNLRPGLYTTLPMKFWHGASDTLIPAAQHSAAFASAVNALGGQAGYTSVPGAGHLDVAALWDGPGLLAFLGALSHA